MEDLVCGRVEVDRSKPINPLGDMEPDMTIRRPDQFVDLPLRQRRGRHRDGHHARHPRRGPSFQHAQAHRDSIRRSASTPPQFGHIPLILNRSGGKMSKRDQGASVQSYMDEGYAPGSRGQLPVPARLVTQGQPREAADLERGRVAFRAGQDQPAQCGFRHGQMFLAQRAVHPRNERWSGSARCACRSWNAPDCPSEGSATTISTTSSRR